VQPKRRYITIEGSPGGDNFGYAISMSRDGNILAVGCKVGTLDDARAGKVQFFQFTNNEWVEMGQDLLGATGDGEFGYAVSLSVHSAFDFFGRDAQWPDFNSTGCFLAKPIMSHAVQLRSR